MLAFKMLGSQSKDEVGLRVGIDVDQAISCGMRLLQEIGDQSQPLAFRYLQSLRKLETRLASLSQAARMGDADSYRPPLGLDSHDAHAGQERPSDPASSFTADVNSSGAFGFPLRPNMDEHPMGDFMMPGEGLLEIENMFYSTAWGNLMDV